MLAVVLKLIDLLVYHHPLDGLLTLCAEPLRGPRLQVQGLPRDQMTLWASVANIPQHLHGT